MTKPPIDVDRVVREVIADLGLAPEAAAAEGPGATPPPAADGDLVLSCRVVTLSELEGRLATVRRLVVPPQAVITPAVHDELHRRNVTLALAASPTPEAVRSVRLVVVTAGRRFDATALVNALAGAGLAVEPQVSDCLIAATDRLAAEVAKADTLGLLLSRHTAAALCLANRHRGVRAVLVTDVSELNEATASVGANLLIADPGARSLFQLKQLATEFCRGGARPCPEVFRQRLA
jgi:hypothetical protein